MSQKSTSSAPYSCPNCQIGQCRPERGIYLQMQGDALISVPDMPVWSCDICGHYEYEPESVSQIEAMIGEREEQPNPARSSTKMPPVDAPEQTTVRRVKP